MCRHPVRFNRSRRLIIVWAVALAVIGCRKVPFPGGPEDSADGGMPLSGRPQDCTYLESRTTRQPEASIGGVDILVVDNSASMA